MRVRSFELRLVALGLTALWSLFAVYVILGYRPGGPIDGLVGLTAMLPMAVALAAVIWPPVARGRNAFAALVWLGLGAALLLVPSIGAVLNQLLDRGRQTLLPSLQVAYPWALALAATSLFAGLGISRHLLGHGARRRHRLVRGVVLALVLMVGVGSLFTTAAVTNDLALRSEPIHESRFGPVGGNVEPPQCDGDIRAGPAAVLDLTLTGAVDGRTIGTVQVDGTRAGTEIRWIGDVATETILGRRGVAVVGGRAWVLGPGSSWLATPPPTVADQELDLQVLATALAPGIRATAEDHNIELVEGARARHCLVAVDGPIFLAAIPQAAWLVAGDSLRRWRGELDYWIFSDGEIGQVTGGVSGPPPALGVAGIQGTIRVALTATNRDVARTIVPPQ